MDDVILSIIVVTVFLVVLMVLLLLTTRRVNILAKKNFVDKLQEYDFLIDDKEKKIEEMNKTISEQRKKFEELEKLRIEREELLAARLDDSEVVLPRHASLEDNRNILADYKAIRDEFDFNVEKIVRKFVEEHPVDPEKLERYRLFMRLRVYFSFKTVYKLSTYRGDQQKEIVKQLLQKDEWQVMEKLIPKNKKFDLNEIVQKIERNIAKYDPKIYVHVPDQNRDYSYIDKNIVTVNDKKITEGFKIVYGGVLFDYSI